MKRTAKVERFANEHGKGWKVICRQGNESLHDIYVYEFCVMGIDLSLRVALSRAEIWLASGVALSFPVVGAGAVEAGVIQ